MGTSVSQRSPSTPNWRVVDTGYTRKEIPVDRLTQEIWRAALNQPEGNLFRDLAEPIIAQCLRIVEQAPTRMDALQQIRRAIALSGQTSLAVEIAQRAVIPTFLSAGDRTGAFVLSLFSEAGNYLVSRDLPGFVGLGRLRNISEAIELKNNIRTNITQRVAEVSPPSTNISDTAVWRDYVGRVVAHISGGTA